ncbi:S8 family serine peptidase [Chitinophaga barathri]|uniref:Peptidase S8/S53 domain-containing protein n=1 Tax=Chitinophaga barathri TaxID=1647451 RepID=A0A3N4MDK8_9BACT|nr:S8 family serine peptidase [Chitinophaga barathri]RPD39677.1 hypothetical protein EG028_18715 [Chitinophaga barathri]
MRKFLTRPCLFLTLCAWATILPLQLYAQQQDILRRYTIPPQDTMRRGKEARSTTRYYLVQFQQPVSLKELQQLQLKRSLSPLYHIVQKLPEDSTTAWWPANGNWKASDALLRVVEKTKEKDSIQVLANISAHARFVRWETKDRTALMKVARQDWEQFIGDTAIQFADILRTPKAEILISSADPGLNRITAVWQQLPDLQGDGLIISLKETLFDTTDIDLLQRYLPTPLAPEQTEPHATIMATFIAGAGNSGMAGKGVAPKVKIASSSFTRLSADETAYFTTHRIALQNHSYGTGIENYYGLEAVAYDEQVYETDTLLHVFSSGNSGRETSTDGLYSGIAGWANLSGTFKQAKNVLVVGGTENNNTVPAPSSKGPAYDGRIKPEIVAYGKDGTSGAAALVSGVSLLLQQSYRAQAASLPPAALLKAILVNSADDIAQPGPDHSSGFGAMNAWEAVQTVRSRRFFLNRVQQGAAYTQSLEIPAGSASCKVTLCYTDPPATVNSPQALINDLDLYLTDASGNVYQPWVLLSTPDAAALQAPAQRGRDSINNTEQVMIRFPAAGTYTIHVNGTRIHTGEQRFAVSWQLAPQDHFEWQRPVGNETIPGGEETALRWKSTLAGKGLASYSLDNGASWQVIGDSVSLEQDGLSWPVPNRFSPALLKMETPGHTFISPPFTISPLLRLQTGFDCADSAMIFWNQLNGASYYIVYGLLGAELTAFAQTADTFLVLQKNAALPAYFAVQPVAASAGLTSNTLRYAEQGLDCYTRQFTADLLENGQVMLQLQTGTTWNLETISWERLQKQDWQNIGRQTVSALTFYNALDEQPPEGIVWYRAALETLNNSVIYTDPVPVHVLRKNNFLLFPNPAAHTLQLLSRDIRGRDLYILNTQGRIVRQAKITGLLQAVALDGLPAGNYWCLVYEDDQKVYTAPFVKL